ncbi:MAG: ribosomal-processing cysteine protease Prp [Clostridiales bacterium]|nr:ribosomal-processing cysteine protease Prp [Clostridiales bacterium]
MTRVTVEYEGDRITRLESVGHAGGRSAGTNIVCAAVSILMETCANALESVAGVTPELTVDEALARIDIRLPQAEGQAQRDAQTILRTTLLGLTDISHEYPKMVKLNILMGGTNHDQAESAVLRP